MLEPAQQLGAGEDAICTQGEAHLKADAGIGVCKGCAQERHCPVVADSQEVGEAGNREIQKTPTRAAVRKWLRDFSTSN